MLKHHMRVQGAATFELEITKVAREGRFFAARVSLVFLKMLLVLVSSPTIAQELPVCRVITSCNQAMGRVIREDAPRDSQVFNRCWVILLKESFLTWSLSNFTQEVLRLFGIEKSCLQFQI